MDILSNDDRYEIMMKAVSFLPKASDRAMQLGVICELQGAHYLAEYKRLDANPAFSDNESWPLWVAGEANYDRAKEYFEDARRLKAEGK